MSPLAIILLVLFCVLFCLCLAVVSFAAGMRIFRKLTVPQMTPHQAEPCGFVRRLPEQEPGEAEQPTLPSFEQNIKDHGYSIVWMKGGGKRR